MKYLQKSPLCVLPCQAVHCVHADIYWLSSKAPECCSQSFPLALPSQEIHFGTGAPALISLQPPEPVLPLTLTLLPAYNFLLQLLSVTQ